MRIKVENSYEDGRESTLYYDVFPEPRLADLLDNGLDDGSACWWWEDVAFEYTGDGIGTGGSSYTVTIIEADNAEIVGQTYEWSD